MEEVEEPGEEVRKRAELKGELGKRGKGEEEKERGGKKHPPLTTIFRSARVPLLVILKILYKVHVQCIK